MPLSPNADLCPTQGSQTAHVESGMHLSFFSKEKFSHRYPAPEVCMII